MSIRKIAVVLVVLAATSGSARADVGLGIFIGRPFGFDAKLGLGNKSGLDIVLGWDTYRESAHGNYGHVTYLLTPAVGHGRSVIVPIRVGIGVAVFDDFYFNDRYFDDFNVAVRAPFELGLRFRSVPLEIYGELALRLTFLRDTARRELIQLDGGIGFRFYL